VCIGGLGMLVGSDLLTARNFAATARGKGDVFMIVGATLYGFSKRLILHYNAIVPYRVPSKCYRGTVR
jgi:hypothetical protein